VGIDPRLKSTSRDIKAKKAFQFIEAGKIIVIDHREIFCSLCNLLQI
jgi:hypothetical protein